MPPVTDPENGAYSRRRKGPGITRRAYRVIPRTWREFFSNCQCDGMWFAVTPKPCPVHNPSPPTITLPNTNWPGNTW